MATTTISVLVEKSTGRVEHNATVPFLEDENGIPTSFPDVPEGWLIDPDLTAVQGLDEKYWKVVNDQVVPMTTQEQAAVDAAELNLAKARKIQTIRAHTVSMLDDGFSYMGKTILVTMDDLLRLTIMANADQASFQPIVWPATDGTFVEINTMGDFTTFYKKASARAFELHGGARTLEESVRSATDVAGVDAVVDNR